MHIRKRNDLTQVVRAARPKRIDKTYGRMIAEIARGVLFQPFSGSLGRRTGKCPPLFVESRNHEVEWADRDFFRSGEINVARLVMTDMPRICGDRRFGLGMKLPGL